MPLADQAAALDHMSRSVSCASSSFCVAVGGLHALVFNGVAWSAPASVEGNREVEEVSCVSSSFCVAMGSGYAVTFNGVGWSEPIAMDPSNPVSALFPFSVSCPLTSFCAVITDGENVLTFDGGSWSAPATIESRGGLSALSCPSSSFCVAVDTNGDALIASEAPPPPSSVSLPTMSVPGSAAQGCLTSGGHGGDRTVQVARAPSVSVRRDTVLIPLSFRDSADSPRCRVTLTLTVHEKLRRGRLLAVSATTGRRRGANKTKLILRTVILGRRTVTVTGDESEMVHVALNTAGRRLLKARHVHALKLTISENGFRLSSQIMKVKAPIKKGA